MTESSLSRRDFLKTGAVAAAAVAGCSPRTQRSDGQTHLQRIFGDISMTDQQGREFRPAELLADKPCLVLFGFEGCPRCQTIANSVASIQQKLVAEGLNVPIVVVSVQPETDRQENHLQPYIEMYYEHGVRQFAHEPMLTNKEERAALGRTAFETSHRKTDAGKQSEQKERLFHIACPTTADQSKLLQNRISDALKEVGSNKMLITHKDPKQHTSFITLFNAGMAVEAYRALDENQQAPQAHTKVIAGDIARKVAELRQERGR